MEANFGIGHTNKILLVATGKVIETLFSINQIIYQQNRRKESMPSEESQAYLDLRGKLANLSKGLVKHASDKDFPAHLTAAAVEEKIALLDAKRKAFTDSASVTHQKSEEYTLCEGECDAFFSGYAQQIYGALGKQNLLVEDFGLKIWQKPSGRKPKENGSDKETK
jgi:hypothetical protein